MTDAWSRRCGMCFAQVSRGETFPADLDPGVRPIPAFDDGVHLVSGPLSLPSLAEQHLAGSAAWTARTSRFIGTVPIRLAGKPGRQWDERKSALIRISPLLSTVSVGLSDSISLLDSSMTSGPASRSKPGCTAAGRLPTRPSIRMASGIALPKAERWPASLPKSARRIAYRFDRRLYAHRHTIENYFARIKRHRRIATRYEKLAVTFLGFVQFATVLDWLTHEV
jgi:hypothetical protein